jgi:hypothetical protein
MKGTSQRRNAYHCLLESHPNFWSDTYGAMSLAVSAAAIAFVWEGGRFRVHEKSVARSPLGPCTRQERPGVSTALQAARSRLCRLRKNHNLPWVWPLSPPRDTHPRPRERHLVAILPRPVDGGMVFDGIRPKLKRLPTPHQQNGGRRNGDRRSAKPRTTKGKATPVVNAANCRTRKVGGRRNGDRRSAKPRTTKGKGVFVERTSRHNLADMNPHVCRPPFANRISGVQDRRHPRHQRGTSIGFDKKVADVLSRSPTNGVILS